MYTYVKNEGDRIMEHIFHINFPPDDGILGSMYWINDSLLENLNLKVIE